MERIPIPRTVGKYVNIYSPAADIYRGRNTQSFTFGEKYESWTTNDFSIIKSGDEWHMVGITHPTPPDFVDEFTFTKNYIHEAEEVLFHSVTFGNTFADVMKEGAFKDAEKLLYPSERPDEIPEIHAPHLTHTKDGSIRMIYGPRDIRLATTRDFKTFERRLLFVDRDSARDPFLFEENGEFLVVFAVENRVDFRSSKDLVSFSETKTLQVNPFSSEEGMQSASESPFLFKHGDFYYLFWAIYDGRLGMYDHRTFVFGARTLEGLKNSAPLTILPAHAGEIYEDESGIYLLSAFHPSNGVSAIKLVFEKDL